MCGILKIGDEIEVRPGIVSKDSEGKIKCRPIFSRIITLLAEKNSLQFAVPGGLIGKTKKKNGERRRGCIFLLIRSFVHRQNSIII